MSEEQNNEALNKAMAEEPAKERRIYHRNNDGLVRVQRDGMKRSPREIKVRSYTVLIDLEPIDAKFIMEQYANAKEGAELVIRANVGTSIVHPADQFCRKTGRETAVKNMREVMLKVDDVYIDENQIEVGLVNDVEKLSFNLVRYKDSGLQRLKMRYFNCCSILEEMYKKGQS